MLGVLGILLSLGLLMYLAYRGINVLVLAPIMALLAVLIGGGADVLLPTYTQIFMKELGGYLIRAIAFKFEAIVSIYIQSFQFPI